jgi:hypothetical protein
MNYIRLSLATLAGTVTYFVLGGVMFGLLPAMVNEFRKYPAVYRNQEEMKSVFPIGIVGMLVAILTMTIIYSIMYQGGSGAVEGARLGALMGIFAVCGFVIHNYVNLNIGVMLTIYQGVAYFIEWITVGLVIGLIYKPTVGH